MIASIGSNQEFWQAGVSYWRRGTELSAAQQANEGVGGRRMLLSALDDAVSGRYRANCPPKRPFTVNALF